MTASPKFVALCSIGESFSLTHLHNIYGEVFHAAATAAIAALFQVSWKIGFPFPPVSAWIADDEHWVWSLTFSRLFPGLYRRNRHGVVHLLCGCSHAFPDRDGGSGEGLALYSLKEK